MSKKYGIWARDLNDWIRGPWEPDGSRHPKGWVNKRVVEMVIRQSGCQATCEVRELPGPSPRSQPSPSDTGA